MHFRNRLTLYLTDIEVSEIPPVKQKNSPVRCGMTNDLKKG